MADSKDDLTAKAHFDPNWIAWNGGYLHSNNVLFYFATSPFFDQVSGNQSLFTQWAGTPNQNDILGTRAKFEANLRHQRGVQYVVEHDPLEEKVFFEGADGPEKSNVWVIRKQHRDNESDSSVTVLGYYFIVNDVIYQAPSVAGVMNYRLLNTVSALNKLFSTPSELSYFSVCHGHTYQKPAQQSPAQALAAPAQQSKESTPVPGTQPVTADKSTAAAQAKDDPNSGARTAWDALRMTLQYGKEYTDDMPLVGEPGNFRFSKNKEVAGSQATGQPSLAAATGTASQSRAASAVPPASNHAPAGGKGPRAGDKATSMPEAPGKAKRRKSKAGEPSP